MPVGRSAGGATYRVLTARFRLRKSEHQVSPGRRRCSSSQLSFRRSDPLALVGAEPRRSHADSRGCSSPGGSDRVGCSDD